MEIFSDALLESHFSLFSPKETPVWGRVLLAHGCMWSPLFPTKPQSWRKTGLRAPSFLCLPWSFVNQDFLPGFFLSFLSSENPPRTGSLEPFPTALQLSSLLLDPLHTPNQGGAKERLPHKENKFTQWLGRRPFSACGREPQMPELLQNSIQRADVSRIFPSLLWRIIPGWKMAARLCFPDRQTQ